MKLVGKVLVVAAAVLSLASIAMADDLPVQLHGYIQNRLYGGPGANPELRVERLSLSAIAKLPNDSTGYTELYYQPYATASGAYLESAYYDTPVGDGRLRVGRGRRYAFGITPTAPNRKTSNYGLIDEAFQQDRTQGVQYMRTKGELQISAAVVTNYRLDVRNVGDIPGDETLRAKNMSPHLAFREVSGALSNKLALNTRVGGVWQNGLCAGLSASLSTLDPRDVTNLTTSSAANTLTPNGTPALVSGSTSDKCNVFGADFMYKHKSGLLAQGEFYDASVSALSYNGWDALVGYEKPSGWKYYVRYGRQNMNGVKTANPLSWDSYQTTFSVVQPIRKNLWMQYEYELNSQVPAPGSAKTSDNLFFAELFTGF